MDEPLEGRDFWHEDAQREASQLAARANSDDPMERWAVIFALGDLDTLESRELLVELSRDSDESVAAAAGATLVRLQRRKQAAPGRRTWASSKRLYEERREAVISVNRDRLFPLLDDDRDFVRAAAARGLGEMQDEACAAALVRLLGHDPEASVRMAAAWALGAIGSPGAAVFVCHALGDEDPSVRAAAAAAAGEFCDTDCAESLAERLRGDDEPTVRLNACASLASCAASVEQHGRGRERRFLVCEEAIEALREAADSDVEDDIREYAAEVLLDLDDLEETTGNGESTVMI